MIEDLDRALEARHLRPIFAEMKSPARAKLSRYGLDQALPEDRFFPTLNSAVKAYRAQSGQDWQATAGLPPEPTTDAGSRAGADPGAALAKTYPLRVIRGVTART